jgi:SAM-dependent methyltransferase
MKTSEEIKELVKEKYSEIATQDPSLNAASCCGMDGCATIDYSIFSEDYADLEGYLASADLQLGCGMPVEYAGISKGDTVVDLGSGAGNDVFIARALAGETGEVIGIDMTPTMIEKAKANAKEIGLKNVKFRLGEIEDLPMANGKADVVISNCVLNLVPDKEKAFAEVHRVLKPGGHFCISDVVLKGELPAKIREAGEMYAGCVAGALQKRDYMGIVHDQGFQNVSIKAEKEIVVPDEILLKYMNQADLDAFRASGTGIYSITVYADKVADEACCDPASGCC